MRMPICFVRMEQSHKSRRGDEQFAQLLHHRVMLGLWCSSEDEVAMLDIIGCKPKLTNRNQYNTHNE